MNATIRMVDGRATLPASQPDVEISRAEMARRLELFEIALREERIEALQAQLAAADRAQIELHRSYRDQIKALQQDAAVAANYIAELEDAGRQLTEERDRSRAECRKLTVASGHADQQLLQAAAEYQKLERAHKELKQLNPERLSKQVKRLQKEKAELQEATSQLRTTNKRLQRQNRELIGKVATLDAALDKAIADINAGQKLEPISTLDLGALGTWEVYGCEEVGRYDLLDRTHNVSQALRIEGDTVTLPKLRPVPKKAQAMLLELHRNLLAKAAGATESEAKEA